MSIGYPSAWDSRYTDPRINSNINATDIDDSPIDKINFIPNVKYGFVSGRDIPKRKSLLKRIIEALKK